MGYRQYSTIFTGTQPELLKPHAEVIELRIYHGMKSRDIAKLTGMGKSQVNNIIKKYKPKQGGRDIVLTISSKLNHSL